MAVKFPWPFRKPEERLVGEFPGGEGKPDRLEYAVVDRLGRERRGHRTRTRHPGLDLCPHCGGIVREIHLYDAALSEEEGGDAWSPVLRCEQCGWEPSEDEPCVDWRLSELIFDDDANTGKD